MGSSADVLIWSNAHVIQCWRRRKLKWRMPSICKSMMLSKCPRQSTYIMLKTPFSFFVSVGLTNFLISKADPMAHAIGIEVIVHVPKVHRLLDVVIESTDMQWKSPLYSHVCCPIYVMRSAMTRRNLYRLGYGLGFSTHH